MQNIASIKRTYRLVDVFFVIETLHLHSFAFSLKSLSDFKKKVIKKFQKN